MGVRGFDDFFSAEQERIIRLCWLLTLDREAAVELAQESMARAEAGDWELSADCGGNLLDLSEIR